VKVVEKMFEIDAFLRSCICKLTNKLLEVLNLKKELFDVSEEGSNSINFGLIESVFKAFAI
jgi:hypothetical protein